MRSHPTSWDNWSRSLFTAYYYYYYYYLYVLNSLHSRMNCCRCFRSRNRVAPGSESLADQQDPVPEDAELQKEGETSREEAAEPTEPAAASRPEGLSVPSKPGEQVALSPAASFRSSLLTPHEERPFSGASVGYRAGSESTLRAPEGAKSRAKVLKGRRERAVEGIPASSSSSTGSNDGDSRAPSPPSRRKGDTRTKGVSKKRWFQCPL